MQGKDTSLLLLLKSNAQFSIPIYQRKYSWEETQCKQLFQSIEKISLEPNREWHFLGSIIYLASQEEVMAGETTEFQVIDGQQRLTSINLLLLALADCSKELLGDKYDESDVSFDKLLQYVANTDCDKSDARYYKIKLSAEDNEAYKKLWETRILPEGLQQNRIYNNYGLFCSLIKESKLSPEQIFNGIKKLKIINFGLKVSDNAQLVFETVNSTGLKLSVPDKIRNFIFMNENDFSSQQKLYKDYWHPMEIALGLTDDNEEEFNRFFEYYMTVVLQEQLKGDRYELFKDYFYHNKSKGVLSIVKEVFQYSKHYSHWLSASSSGDKVDKLLYEIRATGHWQTVPVILKLLEDPKKQIITQAQVITVLEAILAYWMRRDICELPTNSVGNACISMLKSLGKDDYADGFVSCMIDDLTWAQRIPTDADMKDVLHTAKFYKNHICRKVLDRIEMHLNKDYVHNGKHSIEHVMPETIQSHDELYARTDLSDEVKKKKDWANDLGADWEEVYEKYTHTIGNLTLTGYNSEYQNYLFSIKRDMQEQAEDGKKYGYKYSPINMSTSIAQKASWGKDEILARTDDLVGILTEIWKYPALKAHS